MEHFVPIYIALCFFIGLFCIAYAIKGFAEFLYDRETIMNRLKKLGD